jgi:hypothetical protein
MRREKKALGSSDLACQSCVEEALKRLIRILARQAVHEAVASTPESTTDLTKEA